MVRFYYMGGNMDLIEDMDTINKRAVHRVMRQESSNVLFECQRYMLKEVTIRELIAALDKLKRSSKAEILREIQRSYDTHGDVVSKYREIGAI